MQMSIVNFVFVLVFVSGMEFPLFSQLDIIGHDTLDKAPDISFPMKSRK